MPHVHPRPGMVSVVSEPSHPLVAALEGLVAKLRWHLDALREWVRRLGMTQKEDEYDPREPPDVERHPFHNRDLAEFVKLASKLGWHYHEGNKGCDESKLTKIVVGVGITVIAAFIIGGWVQSNQVSSMNATMVARFNEQDRRFAEQNDRISRLEIKTERIRRDE